MQNFGVYDLACLSYEITLALVLVNVLVQVVKYSYP